MSKGFNKILDFMKLNDDEYEEYDDEEIDTEEELEEAPKKKTFARSTANSRKTSARQKDRAAATAIVIRHFNEQTGDGLLIFSFLSYIK